MSSVELAEAGTFTKYLIEGLAENKELVLTSEPLYGSFYESVELDTDIEPDYGEIKYVGHKGGDFVFIQKWYLNKPSVLSS